MTTNAKTTPHKDEVPPPLHQSTENIVRCHFTCKGHVEHTHQYSCFTTFYNKQVCSALLWPGFTYPKWRISKDANNGVLSRSSRSDALLLLLLVLDRRRLTTPGTGLPTMCSMQFLVKHSTWHNMNENSSNKVAYILTDYTMLCTSPATAPTV